MTRTCKQCGGPNERGPLAKYCSKSCHQKSWLQSEGGRAYKRAYGQTDRARATQKAYRQSEKYKAWQKAYEQSERGKAAKSAYHRSDRGKSVKQAYDRSDAGKARAWRSRASRYGITVERLEELLNAGCFVPHCDSRERLNIDHDHACCPGAKSCGNCVRGALCHRHNIFLGFLEADWVFAIWALRQPSLVFRVRREA